MVRNWKQHGSMAPFNPMHGGREQQKEPVREAARQGLEPAGSEVALAIKPTISGLLGPAA